MSMKYTVSARDNKRFRLGVADREQSILQNIALILATPKGSVPLYRDFGLSQEMLDRPREAAKPLLRAAVKEAIQDWEPRAAFVELDFLEDGDGLRPLVTVEILEEE